MSEHLEGLRTVIYPSSNLAESRAWWSGILGVEPYFDEPFYVGFSVAGYELGLLPDAAQGALVYWGVGDVQDAIDVAIAQGAAEHSPPTDVGDDIVTGSVRTPDGSILGFIRNPHFTLG